MIDYSKFFGGFISINGNTVKLTGNASFLSKECFNLPITLELDVNHLEAVGLELKTLEGCTKLIIPEGININLSNNKLVNLNGFPKIYTKFFNISNNPIESLDGINTNHLRIDTDVNPHFFEGLANNIQFEECRKQCDIDKIEKWLLLNKDKKMTLFSTNVHNIRSYLETFSGHFGYDNFEINGNSISYNPEKANILLLKEKKLLDKGLIPKVVYKMIMTTLSQLSDRYTSVNIVSKGHISSTKYMRNILDIVKIFNKLKSGDIYQQDEKFAQLIVSLDMYEKYAKEKSINNKYSIFYKWLSRQFVPCKRTILKNRILDV